MTLPRLTFFCELEPEPLQSLMSDALMADLAKMRACLSLGIVDLSQERAQVVRRLNQAGIPMIAWLLLPKEQGYWFNIFNAPQAARRYVDFREWTDEHGLDWSGVGLDIEPDIREIAQFSNETGFISKWRLLPQLLRRLFNRSNLTKARKVYLNLIAQIRADGYLVESYQFPMITDERRAGSTLLQRAVGLVDLPVDNEVWMAYSSFVRPNGAGLIASYAPEAQSLGLGSTGGGVDSDFAHFEPLTWDELGRDLRLAWYWCNDLYIFSLEGCVRQGFMERLKSFAWDYPMLIPEESLVRVNGWRHALRAILWVGAHLTVLLLSLVGMILLDKGLRRWLRARQK